MAKIVRTGPMWIAAVLLAVLVVSPAALASPITSAANIPYSGIAPGGIDMATGEIIVVCRPDLSLGGPMALSFGRYYASMLGREGLASGHMGPNWLGTYDWRLIVSGSTADVITNLGADIKFQQPPAGGPWTLVSPLDHKYVLQSLGGTTRFTDPVARRIYSFTGSPALLTQIADEHGNTVTLTLNGTRVTQVSDGLGRALQFTYDPRSGMLVSAGDGTRTVIYSYTGVTLTGFTDAAGQHWTYAYAPGAIQGLLIGTTEPLGNTPLVAGYDASGRVTSLTDAAGGAATYAWDGPAGNVFTDPLGRAWAYLHDPAGRLMSLTDTEMRVWARAYDPSGRLMSETRPLGDMTSYAYDAASGYPATVGFADGSVMHWTYGSHSIAGGTFYDLASRQFPDLDTEMFTRDAAGNPTDIADRGGFHWQATYNARGQVLTATNPAGGVTSVAYDPSGHPAVTTDPAGNVTRFTYDALSRLVAIAPDDTSSNSWAYDALDHVIRAPGPPGKFWTYAYDANGRLTGRSDPLLETTQYSYDGLDRLTQTTDPSGDNTVCGYDACGHLASLTDGTGHATTYSYNVWGDLAGMVDALGAGWTFGFDPNRQVTLARDPLGHETLFTHDTVDRLRHLTDPAGAGFDYGYDTMDRLRSERGPLGLSHTYGYDPRGLMTSAIDATSEYDYARDPLGNVSTFTDPNRNASPYSYDSQGRLTMASDPLGRSSSYSYDARGRLSHATLPGTSASLAYDGANRLLSLSFTGGLSLAYSYDDANRLTGGTGAAFGYDGAGRMTSSNGLSFAYDAAGRIVSETYSPGHTVSYAYNERGALTQVTDWIGGVTSFSYDAAGNYTGTTRPNGTNGAYGYDAAGGLVNAVERQPGPQGSPISSLTITRDALEQPTAVERVGLLLPTVQSPGSSAHAYDAASQVAGLAWDARGRLLGDGSRTLVWDDASRLSSYTAPGESQSLGYDAFGRLVSRTQGAVSEQFVWSYANGSPTLDVVMNGGTPVRYFVHTPSGLLLESIEAAGGARRFYHFDENGGTALLTDDRGAAMAAYAYGPYGDVRSSGATGNNPFTMGGSGGTIQLGSSGLFLLSGGGVYDTKLARIVSGGAIASGARGGKNPGPGGLVSVAGGFYYYFEHSDGKHGLKAPGPTGRNPGPTGAPMNGGVPGNGIPDIGIPTNGVPDNGIPDNGIPDSGIPDNRSTFGSLFSNDFIPSVPEHTEGYHSGHVDAYMYIDDGKSAKAKGFEISQFSLGVGNPTHIGSATGGAGGGKAGFHEFTITKTIDASSAALFESCSSGYHYKNVTIDMRQAGSGTLYLEYRFGTAFIESIHWSGHGDEGPEESITFQFGSVDIRYGAPAGQTSSRVLNFLEGNPDLPIATSSRSATRSATPQTQCTWCTPW